MRKAKDLAQRATSPGVMLGMKGRRSAARRWDTWVWWKLSFPAGRSRQQRSPVGEVNVPHPPLYSTSDFTSRGLMSVTQFIPESSMRNRAQESQSFYGSLLGQCLPLLGQTLNLTQLQVSLARALSSYHRRRPDPGACLLSSGRASEPGGRRWPAARAPTAGSVLPASLAPFAAHQGQTAPPAPGTVNHSRAGIS